MRRFVVQRHRARRLHYDFRLEIDEVLVSWAVPKGPTLDPGVRRAAFHVEDHPLSYFDFEGVIPAGEYGGGDVIVWDAGTWRPYKEDPSDGVANGELHVELQGEKLHGKFVLVRTRSQPSGKDDWLLIKKRDEFAVEGWDPEDYPRSVLSGRTNEEVKADPHRLTDGLAELESLKDSGSWNIFGRKLRVTNLGKELFPARKGEKPVTKRDFLRYAAQIAPVVLPYLAKRQPTLPSRAPGWLPRGEGHVVIDEPAALVWAANSGALEWHPIDHVLIDLDPGGEESWDDLLVLARLHRTAFEHLGVKARAMVTGRSGIHIWVPVKPGPSFEQTRKWAQQLSKAVGAVVPDLAGLWAARGGTLIAPYSPRSAPGAPVSAPIDWEELDDPDLAPDGFTVRSMPERLAAKGDLFREVLHHTQQLPRLA